MVGVDPAAVIGCPVMQGCAVEQHPENGIDELPVIYRLTAAFASG